MWLWANPDAGFEQGRWMKHIQKVPSGLSDSLLYLLKTFLVHTAVTTWYRNSPLALRHFSSWGRNSPWHCNRIFARSCPRHQFCVHTMRQFLPKLHYKRLVSPMCVGETATFLLLKYWVLTSSVNGFASLTAQQQWAVTLADRRNS